MVSFFDLGDELDVDDPALSRDDDGKFDSN